MKIITGETLIEVTCSKCGEKTKKKNKYLKERKLKGKTNMFCSRNCADKHHSEVMKGEGNPNFEGKYHGQCPSTWSEQKKRKAILKMKKTVELSGGTRGSKNNNWRGGSKAYPCVICGTEGYYVPNVIEQIEKGLRRPCCSVQCACALGRRGIKKERTSIEIKMAEELDRRGIEYIEQYNLGDKFLLDFFLPKYNMVIECDGDYWHNIPEVALRDKSKNAYMKACGFTVYRFWEKDIKKDVSACVNQIRLN